MSSIFFCKNHGLLDKIFKDFPQSWKSLKDCHKFIYTLIDFYLFFLYLIFKLILINCILLPLPFSHLSLTTLCTLLTLFSFSHLFFLLFQASGNWLRECVAVDKLQDSYCIHALSLASYLIASYFFHFWASQREASYLLQITFHTY